MNKTRRKPLEPWQIDDAARLKAIYEAAGGESQEKFGARTNIGGQALVWQYLNGYIPLNLKVAVRFASGLNCRVADFSPRLAEELPPAHENGFVDMLEALPAQDAQQVLDFISYKFERSEGLAASESMARYSLWADKITKDLERRRAEDSERKPPTS